MPRANCMNCGSTRLTHFIDLGLQPNGNAFPEPGPSVDEPVFPMAMLVCEECWQVQIDEFPPQELLFSDHPYITGANKPVVEHFARLARHVVDKLALRPQSLVFDIGCNDGTLLKQFHSQGMRVLGFDPSLRVGQLAREQGVSVCRTFWNESAGQAVRTLGLVPDVITATGVFYHVPDLHDFVRGLVAAMGPDSVFVAQCVSLKELIERNEFDHFYHEHSCIHAVAPLQRLFAAHGMRILDVEFSDIHGGSFIVYAGMEGHPAQSAPSVEQALRDEESAGLSRLSTYREFVTRVDRNASELVALLGRLRAQGKRVYALGAPVKGSTLLNYCKIGPALVERATEVNHFKIGRVTPGTHIPIVDEARVSEPPDYYLVLSWNFLGFLLEKYRDFLNAGGRFIVPCPEVRVIGMANGTLTEQAASSIAEATR